MKRFLGFPLLLATAFLFSILAGCGGSGGSSSGTGGTGGPDPFCETNADCEEGSTNECSVASCDTGQGVCISTPVPEGTSCNDDAGVCRDGFCAATELKAYVKSPNPEPNALFGTGVSILGDRMIVGAPSSGPPFGKAAVFERADGEWSFVQEIETPRLSGGGTDGLFAWTVASADTFFVVGSLGFSLGGSGSVRVFRNNTGTWQLDPFGYIVPEDGPAHPLDLFATSIALTPSGDTLVVGAPGHSTGELPISFFDRDYSGAAYVFDQNNSIWTEAAMLRASNAGGSYECEVCEEFACPTSGEGDGFGAAVAIWNDTVVVGAPGEASAATGVNGNESDDSAPGAGAAYVFERVGDTWEQTAYLKASNTDAGDRFGFAVAIHGDTIAVGAEREDSGDPDNQGDNTALEAGAVYVFERVGDTWQQMQYLKASNVDEGYFFGANLTMSDTTLIVGSPGESSVGGVNSGAAYVFNYVDGVWTQTNFYKAFNADAESAFAGPPGSVAYGEPSSLISCEVQATTTGASLSLSGDTLAVGTPYEDSSAVGVNGVPTSNSIPDSGAVYIFDNSEGQ
jgi:hypothetical protein